MPGTLVVLYVEEMKKEIADSADGKFGGEASSLSHELTLWREFANRLHGVWAPREAKLEVVAGWNIHRWMCAQACDIFASGFANRQWWCLEVSPKLYQKDMADHFSRSGDPKFDAPSHLHALAMLAHGTAKVLGEINHGKKAKFVPIWTGGMPSSFEVRDALKEDASNWLEKTGKDSQFSDVIACADQEIGYLLNPSVIHSLMPSFDTKWARDFFLDQLVCEDLAKAILEVLSSRGPSSQKEVVAEIEKRYDEKVSPRMVGKYIRDQRKLGLIRKISGLTLTPRGEAVLNEWLK